MQDASAIENSQRISFMVRVERVVEEAGKI
jgi:hypothetical protein